MTAGSSFQREPVRCLPGGPWMPTVLVPPPLIPGHGPGLCPGGRLRAKGPRDEPGQESWALSSLTTNAYRLTIFGLAFAQHSSKLPIIVTIPNGDNTC
jgi:hypothetical protein